MIKKLLRIVRKIIIVPLKYIYCIFSIFYLRFVFNYERKNIALFVSHDLCANGAPIVLKNVINLCKDKHNIIPLVITYKPGVLVADFIKKGIIPVSCEWYEEYVKKYCLKYDYNLIFLNTILTYKWSYLCEKKGKKYVWWIHEGKEYLKEYITKMPKELKKGRLWFVSEYVRDIVNSYGISMKHDIVPYFINDDGVIATDDTLEEEIHNISIIGNVCQRKNHIELLRALVKLPVDILDSVVVNIVGGISEYDYYEMIQKYIKENNLFNVKFVGEVSHDKIKEIYKNTDLLICCSNDDPLPVVVTEALMYGKKVLVSSNTGQYGFVIDNINGFKYRTGDIQDLAKKIVNAINTPEIRVKQFARELYEEYFTSDKFEKNVNYKLFKG